MTKNITTQALHDATSHGNRAVGELLIDHEQPECVTVPAGSRFVVEACALGKAVALFPHDALDEPRVFSTGHVRIVPQASYHVVGRI